MKKTWVILSLIAVAAAGCLKNDIKHDCNEIKETAPTSETITLKAYLDSAGIAAIADPRGFYYTIETPGSGTKPTVCDGVTADYSGKLTSGTIFDERNNQFFNLYDVILGWEEGIPLIGVGGSMHLYLPPSLGYGSVANGPIPANSILIFKIDLKAIN